MKTNFLITACLSALLSTGSIYATPIGEELPETTRTIKLANNFRQLTLTDVKVVLTNGEASDLYVTGDQNAAKNIIIMNDGSELFVDGGKLQKDDNVVVHISAKLLEKITLLGASQVSANEVIQKDKMDLVVNGDCKVKMKVTGKVNVTAAEGFDYNYESRKLTEELATNQ